MNDSVSGNEILEAAVVTQDSPLTVITKAELNESISTAHAFPRSMVAFRRRALEMATLDEETAESCIYRRPVGKKKNEETGRWEESYAEGMSIRMAEIVGASYGNLRVGATLIEQTERFVRARGYAHDLETNFASTSEVIEATTDKNGNPYSERMRVVVAKAALSKARRDATFSVVPRALCRTIEIEARKVAIGDAASLERRRAAAMQWIAKLGVRTERVFASLGVLGEADIGADHLITLMGLKTALKDGEITIDEAFPLIDAESGAQRPAGPKAKSDTPPPQHTQAPPPEPPPFKPDPAPQQGANAPVAKAVPPTEGGLTAEEEARWQAEMAGQKAPVQRADSGELASAGEQQWLAKRAGARLAAMLQKHGITSLESITRVQFDTLRAELV